MTNYPQLYSIFSQSKQIEPTSDLAQIGSNLLTYLLSRCSFVYLKNITIYQEIKQYFSQNLINILNLHLTKIQLQSILGSFTLDPSYLQKLQLIEKELSQMLTQEDITNPNSYVYEEASICSVIYPFVLENLQEESETLQLKAIKSMSQMSFYDVTDTIEKEKELLQSANEYLNSLPSYNTQLNLFVQKMKFDLGEWQKEQEKGLFKVKNAISVPVDYSFCTYEGYGEGKSIKLAKEEASREMLEKVYKNSPYFMHEMQKVKMNRR